jgi:hypothetical protein
MGVALLGVPMGTFPSAGPVYTTPDLWAIECHSHATVYSNGGPVLTLDGLGSTLVQCPAAVPDLARR